MNINNQTINHPLTRTIPSPKQSINHPVTRWHVIRNQVTIQRSLAPPRHCRWSSRTDKTRVRLETRFVYFEWMIDAWTIEGMTEWLMHYRMNVNNQIITHSHSLSLPSINHSLSGSHLAAIIASCTASGEMTLAFGINWRSERLLVPSQLLAIARVYPVIVALPAGRADTFKQRTKHKNTRQAEG